MRAQHETIEQMAFVAWARFFHIEELGMTLDRLLVTSVNGAALSGNARQRAAQWARHVAMGARPGASDTFLALPAHGLHGLWIEFKKRRDQFRGPAEIRRAWKPEQQQFAADMQAAGYGYALCYGRDEGIEAVERYLSGRHQPVEVEDGLDVHPVRRAPRKRRVSRVRRSTA